MRAVLSLIACLWLAPPLAADEIPQATSGAPPVAWPDLEAANFIDERIFARLRELEMVPSPLATDAVFLRRLSLTTIGQLPTAAEVRAFLADEKPDKRARKIDDLLSHKLHAAVWATRFSDWTGNSMDSLEGPNELKSKRAKMWHDWLRKRFEQNVPYDDLVRGILTATSRGAGTVDDWIDREAALIYSARKGFDAPYAEREDLDLFWRREDVGNKYPAEELAERVAASFLGVRINCARCHNHPFHPWTRADYQGFTSVFRQVRFDMSPELRARLADRIDDRRRRAADGGELGPPLPGLREVYFADRPRAVQDPPAKALGGPELAGRDPRVALVDWLNEPQNPFFARNLVNRVWAQHFGRGLVEPLDGLSTANTAAHAGLLDELAADFVEHGYDIRRLERLILNSTTWQLSSEPNDVNRADRGSFARAYVRMPPAETVIDMWQAATGIALDFGDGVPDGIRAVELAPSTIAHAHWNGILKLFGRSARMQTCDCAPAGSPSIRQTLALMSDSDLLGDLWKGDLPVLLEAGLGGDELLDELFLRTLSRPPTADERAAAGEAVRAAKDPFQVFEDILWGLVNSQEFITNH
jgi:hypothetical protein